jgi:hypothetical protein
VDGDFEADRFRNMAGVLNTILYAVTEPAFRLAALLGDGSEFLALGELQGIALGSIANHGSPALRLPVKLLIGNGLSVYDG